MTPSRFAILNLTIAACATLFAAAQGGDPVVAAPSTAPAVAPDDSDPVLNRYLQLADSASLLMNADKWSDAEARIKDALKTMPANPTNTLLFSNLGICQTHTGRYAEALQSYEIALIKAPDSPRILFNRAKTYVLSGNDSLALGDLERVLATDSAATDALRLRASLRLRRHDFQSARQDLTRLRALEGDSAPLLAMLADCAAATETDPTEANRLYHECLKLSPDEDAYFSAILFFIRQDDMASADDTLRQALKEYPREGRLYLLRALTHTRRFQNEQAEIDKKLAADYGIDSQTIESFFPKH